MYAVYKDRGGKIWKVVEGNLVDEMATGWTKFNTGERFVRAIILDNENTRLGEPTKVKNIIEVHTDNVFHNKHEAIQSCMEKLSDDLTKAYMILNRIADEAYEKVSLLEEIGLDRH